MIDWTLSVTRLLQFASILMLFGSAVFCLYGRALAHSTPWPASGIMFTFF
jgi:hypothetical protein